MRLYLMQHALAYSTEEDAERPLNPDGVKQAKQSASGIKRLGLVFDLIMTSPKRRAKQTAALVAEQVRYPYSDIMTTEALLPGRTPAELLELLQKESTDSRILIVGHLPHLALLAETLSGGDLVFENAGLACLEMSGPKTARLAFHLQAGHLDM
jgi:phosphohistidine phosphatase